MLTGGQVGGVFVRNLSKRVKEFEKGEDLGTKWQILNWLNRKTTP